MMTSNQLTPEQRATTRQLGRPAFAAGHGYGMGVAVVMEPEQADPLQCRGGVGSIGLGGWNAIATFHDIASARTS